MGFNMEKARRREGEKCSVNSVSVYTLTLFTPYGGIGKETLKKRYDA